MTAYEVTIDRMTIDLFEFWLNVFWTSLGASRPIPLTITDKDGVSTEGHIAIPADNENSPFLNPMGYRVKVNRQRFAVLFTLERWRDRNAISDGFIYVTQTLADQIRVVFSAADGKNWHERFMGFLAQMFGAIPTASGNPSNPYDVLEWLFNKQIELIIQDAHSIKEKVQRIDDFTITLWGIKLPDSRVAEITEGTIATVHTYRRPV
jgi:hypothetical protein